MGAAVPATGATTDAAYALSVGPPTTAATSLGTVTPFTCITKVTRVVKRQKRVSAVLGTPRVFPTVTGEETPPPLPGLSDAVGPRAMVVPASVTTRQPVASVVPTARPSPTAPRTKPLHGPQPRRQGGGTKPLTPATTSELRVVPTHEGYLSKGRSTGEASLHSKATMRTGPSTEARPDSFIAYYHSPPGSSSEHRTIPPGSWQYWSSSLGLYGWPFHAKMLRWFPKPKDCFLPPPLHMQLRRRDGRPHLWDFGPVFQLKP